MWCHHCDSDVAAEIGPGGERARCATCGTEIAARGTPVQATRTREALQLLDRWSRPHLLDPFQTTPGQERETDEPEFVERDHDAPDIDDSEGFAPTSDENGESVTELESAPAEPALDDSTEEHPDSNSAEPVKYSAEPALGSSSDDDWKPSETGITTEELDEYERVETLIPHESRIAVAAIGTTTTRETTDGGTRPFTEIPMSDESQIRSHGTVRDAIAPDDSVNWVALAGQLLAYGGVAVLTVGTTVALWAHFAGQPSHVPTGWLVAAAGQMLLFLGVVTLVSTGIEQTAIDLQRRFDRVADRLDRVESRIEAGHAERAWASRPGEASSQEHAGERIAA